MVYPTKDVLGKALVDYHSTSKKAFITTETNISEADDMPVDYFFRSFNEMPALEQKALQLTRGKVLDVGCGAGSHSLYLQEKGLDVTAIDISPGAVEVSKMRGIRDVRQQHLFEIKDETFDTILLLMNGTGIFETLSKAPLYFKHLQDLLAPGGHILIDSSDLAYMYDSEENGAIWVPADRYYGALTFTMTYNGQTSEPFDWLYLDKKRMETLCKQQGFHCKIVMSGNQNDYLAQLSS